MSPRRLSVAGFAKTAAKLALIALCLSLLPAHADVLGMAQTQNGVIYIFSEQGICVGKAKRAQYVPKEGKAVEGCWINQPDHLRLAFLDGDSGAIPHTSLKKADTV